MWKLTGAVMIMAGLWGCAPAARGALDAQGYKSTSYALGVHSSAGGSVLPADWRLDNFYDRRGKLMPKNAPEYMTTFGFDTDGDGQNDRTKQEYAYELRYENTKDSGVIWLRTFPISQTDRNKMLRVLMKDYIDDASKAGYEVVVIGMYSQVVERRYAAKPIYEGEAKVGGMPAYEAVVDVANLDRIKVEPNAVEKRVKLALVATGFGYELMRRKGEYPVLMLVGYANSPQDFEAGEKVFDDMLSRIVIGDRHGYVPAAERNAKPADPVAAVAPAPSEPAAAPAATQPPAEPAPPPSGAPPVEAPAQ